MKFYISVLVGVIIRFYKMHGATIKIAYVVRDVNLVNIFINLSTMELCQMKIRFNFIYSERQLIKMLVNPH